MVTSPQSDLLRVRARTLRSLAAKIGASPALAVSSCAGPDTWVGPTPQRCYDSLLVIRRQLQSQQQTLIDAGHALERRADELDTRLIVGRAC